MIVMYFCPLPFFTPFGQKTKLLCILFDWPVNDVNLFKEKLRLKGGCRSKLAIPFKTFRLAFFRNTCDYVVKSGLWGCLKHKRKFFRTWHILARELSLAQEHINMKNAWPGSLGASSPSNQCFGEGCYFGIAEYVGFLEDANIVAQCNTTTSQFNACFNLLSFH